MLHGNYNGWTDMPEDEREALSAYEMGGATALAVKGSPLALIKTALGNLVHRLPRHAA